MITYEQLLELLQTRRSIRRFREQAVTRDELERLLGAARWAPSNHNRQPWKFLVIEEREQIRALAASISAQLARKLAALPALAAGHAEELTHYATCFAGAPLLLVPLHKRPVSVSAALLTGVAEPALVSGEPLSVAMAVQNLLLAAHTLSLGTCVLTAPLLVPEAWAATLQIPAGYDATCFVAVGHPDETPAAPRRKNLEHLFEFRHTAARGEP